MPKREGNLEIDGFVKFLGYYDSSICIDTNGFSIAKEHIMPPDHMIKQNR